LLQSRKLLVGRLTKLKISIFMHDEDEEIEESIFKMDGDDDLDTVEGMNDFGLDEEDPDRDR